MCGMDGWTIHSTTTNLIFNYKVLVVRNHVFAFTLYVDIFVGPIKIIRLHSRKTITKYLYMHTIPRKWSRTLPQELPSSSSNTSSRKLVTYDDDEFIYTFLYRPETEGYILVLVGYREGKREGVVLGWDE